MSYRVGRSGSAAEPDRGLRVVAMTEPGCVMASDSQQNLFSEIEQAQEELRESIESSRRLVERSDALIQQVKDQSTGLRDDASPPA
jgi:hypothetical protein